MAFQDNQGRVSNQSHYGKTKTALCGVYKQFVLYADYRGVRVAARIFQADGFPHTGMAVMQALCKR